VNRTARSRLLQMVIMEPTVPSAHRRESITASISWLPLQELAVACVFFLAALAALTVTRAPGGAALIWPADSIAAALLVRLPRVRWLWAAGALFSAGVLAETLGTRDPVPLAAAMVCVNLVDAGITTWVFRSWVRFPVPNLTANQGMQMTALGALVVPSLTAVPGGLVVHAGLGVPLWPAARDWGLSCVIGACLLAPPFYLYSSKSARRLLAQPFLAQNIADILICLIVCYCSVRFVRFPFVVMAMPLIIAAFRMGGFGVSVASSLCGLMVIGLWVLDVRPLGLEEYRHSSAMVELPLLALAATVLPPIAVGLGIDERRAAVRALRVSEQRFRESLERSPIGMIIADLSGAWITTNGALRRMLGYCAEDLETPPSDRFRHPDDAADVARRQQTLLSGEADSYQVERRYRHANGSWIWVRVAVSLVRNEDGLPLHFIGQVESLEARRKAERDLAEEKQVLKITLAAIADPVITTHADGRITYINAAGEQLLGQSLADIGARKLNDVMVLTDLRTSRVSASVFAKCITSGKVARREEPCSLHRPDGSVRYVTEAASPVLDSDGHVIGTVVVLRDVSSHHERDRELKHRAAHDLLTGLVNRFEFERRAETVFSQARHLERSVAMMVVDLDRFKAVNDAGGHAAGDAVLRKVAAVLKSAARHSDTVARVGGDEFAIILERCSAARAAGVGRQILAALNSLKVAWNETTYCIGASIGVAMLEKEYVDVAAWISAADVACYEVKRTGRGQMVFARAAASATQAAL
jgi:diguanylate cyclase